MKKLFLIGIMLWAIASLAALSWANPFIVCDPQAGVQSYQVTGAAWVPATVPAQPDGSIKMDVSTAPVGTSNLSFRACAQEWAYIDADGNSVTIPGEVCSDPAPFSFTRRAAPATSTGVKLVP